MLRYQRIPASFVLVDLIRSCWQTRVPVREGAALVCLNEEDAGTGTVESQRAHYACAAVIKREDSIRRGPQVVTANSIEGRERRTIYKIRGLNHEADPSSWAVGDQVVLAASPTIVVGDQLIGSKFQIVAAYSIERCLQGREGAGSVRVFQYESGSAPRAVSDEVISRPYAVVIKGDQAIGRRKQIVPADSITRFHYIGKHPGSVLDYENRTRSRPVEDQMIVPAASIVVEGDDPIGG